MDIYKQDLKNLMLSLNSGIIDYVDYIGTTSAFNSNFEKVICELLNISPSDLKSKDRTAKVVIGRRIIYNYLKENTKMTLYEIGKMYNKHHSGVIHHLKKYDDLIGCDRLFMSYAIQFNKEIY